MTKHTMLEKLEWIDYKMSSLSSLRKTFCFNCTRENDCSTCHVPACVDCPYSDFYLNICSALDNAICTHNEIARQLEKVDE